MMDINNVTLTGRLTKDVEVLMTMSQKKYCTFTLAVGRDKENSDFINVVAWEGLADTIGTYCCKGHRIGITGTLRSRSYENKSGQKVYVTEVLANGLVFLEKKEASQRPVDQVKNEQDPFTNKSELVVDKEDLPFY